MREALSRHDAIVREAARGNAPETGRESGSAQRIATLLVDLGDPDGDESAFGSAGEVVAPIE